MAPSTKTPETCPVCGATVPPRALVCGECGADERTGWNEEMTRYDAMDLPDDSFDYDEALRESGLQPRDLPKGLSFFWWLVGLCVLLLFVVSAWG